MKKEYVTPDVEKFEFEVPSLLDGGTGEASTEGVGTGSGTPGEGGD